MRLASTYVAVIILVSQNESTSKMRAIRQESGKKMYCDVCGPKGEACSRCLECEENLCQTCCYVHENSKMSRHHKICDLGTLEPQLKGRIRQRIFCDQHLEEEVKLVCKDCTALICVLCKAIKHENHTSETLSDAAAQVKKNIQITMNQCSDKVRRITDSEREADALDKKINEAEMKEIKALEDQRLQLIEVIDQEVAKMKDKIQNVYKDLRQQNEALKRDMKEELKKCSTANDNAKQLIDKGADIDVIKKGSDLEQLLSTAMTETVQRPMTCMDTDLFSPVEIKVRELIPFIGMMRDSTEISLEEREKPLREEREKLEMAEREKALQEDTERKEKEDRENKEKEERQIKEWSQKMETRVKALEEELSSTRKQYEEAKANAITTGAKLSQAEKEIQGLRNQHADAVAQVNRYKNEIAEREKKEREKKKRKAREDRERKEKEERESKENEEREKKEREDRQIQAYRQRHPQNWRWPDKELKQRMCTKCQGWTHAWVRQKGIGFNCNCDGNK